MGRWFLVRHGETDWNLTGRGQGQSDVPLNARGRAQAQATAARLRPTRFTTAYASDLGRVTQTAQPIMRGRELPLITLPALRERSYGAWEGLTDAEIAARDPHRYAARLSGGDTWAPPGGESMRHLFARVAAAVDRLRDAHARDDGDLLLVAHGGSLRAAIVRLLDLPPASVWRFALDNCGLSVVTTFDGGHTALELLNDTCHLQAGDPAAGWQARWKHLPPVDLRDIWRDLDERLDPAL